MNSVLVTCFNTTYACFKVVAIFAFVYDGDDDDDDDLVNLEFNMKQHTFDDDDVMEYVNSRPRTISLETK